MLIWACHNSVDRAGPVHEKSGVDSPNVLFITIDTLRADHLACYGYPRATSPFLDLLSRGGVTAVASVCTAPYTNPSHASMFTGKYPWEHGCRSNYHKLRERHQTLAEYFKSQNYQTAAFISGSPLRAKVCGLNQGFDIYDDEMSESVFDQRKILRALNQPKPPNTLRTAPGVTSPYARRNGKDTIAGAIQWLSTNPDPWFLWVHLYDVHGPYRPPQPLLSAFRNDIWTGSRSLENIQIPDYQKTPGADRQDFVSRYDACIYYSNGLIQKLVNQLIRVDALSKTLICVLSDHGESLGENNYGFDHGRYLYQSSLHIPMIFVWPDVLPQGRLLHGLVSETVLKQNIERMSSPATFERASIVQRLHRPVNSKLDPFFSKSILFSETKPKHPSESSYRLYGAMTKGFKYIYSEDPDQSELYNLSEDSLEQFNRNNDSQYHHLIRKLRSHIERQIFKNVSSSEDAELNSADKAALRALGYIED